MNKLNPGVWIAIGIGIGTALGVGFDDVAIGVGLGAALGAVMVGITLVTKSKNEKNDSEKNGKSGN